MPPTRAAHAGERFEMREDSMRISSQNNTPLWGSPVALRDAPRGLRYFPLWSCEDYPLELPVGHPFPHRKYALLEERLLEVGFGPFVSRCKPASREMLTLAHEPSYVDRVLSGKLTAQEMRRVGFPGGTSYVQRALASVEATLMATRAARSGNCPVAGALAGGTHHAFRAHGEGYCTFNDIAIAALDSLTSSVNRVLVVDLDAHQGNGTASIFAGDYRVFTMSMHCETNYPREKQKSSLDIGLPAGTGDAVYLSILKEHLPLVFDHFLPDLVFYQSGVDVLATDRFGRLGLSLAGLRARDEFVFREAFARRVPVVITLGGGYAKDHDIVARAHAQTFVTAAETLART